MKEAQIPILKMDTEAACPDSVQEDGALENVRKEPAANEAVCKDISLSHSVFLAAVVTTTIALFSAGIVFSGKYDVAGLDLELPQAIESFLWRNKKTDVKVSVGGQEARSLTEGLVNKRANKETRPLSGSLAAKYQEEETSPAAKEPVGKFSQEVTGEENRDLAGDGRRVETAPTVVGTVQKGDTICLILKRRYGESSGILLCAVRELNPEIEDLNLIRAGQKLRLPLNLEVADQIQSMGGGSALIEESVGTSDKQSGRKFNGTRQPNCFEMLNPKCYRRFSLTLETV